MKRLIIAAALFVVPAIASAQQPQAFVPFTVTEQDARALRALIDEHPMKYSLQILQWMEFMERRAIDQKAAAEKAASGKPASETPKP